MLPTNELIDDYIHCCLADLEIDRFVYKVYVKRVGKPGQQTVKLYVHLTFLPVPHVLSTLSRTKLLKGE